MDLAGVHLKKGESIRFDIEFEPAAPVNGVPEPSTLALLGAAALALAFRRRTEPTTAPAGRTQAEH